MVKYSFNTAKYHFYLEDRDGYTLEQQKQQYEEQIKHYHEIRLENEATAIRAGFRIDDSYQDPDMWQYIIEPAY